MGGILSDLSAEGRRDEDRRYRGVLTGLYVHFVRYKELSMSLQTANYMKIL